ncbi:MAG: LysR family transcriptional regulator [Pseudomonadota bacterium]
MSKIDFLNLDGQILRTFLVILEESSVSRAAERLEVTQSAVSHTLAKLRQILGDPLFVRSGQGLTPTETALSLKGPVLQVLDGLKALTEQRPFDPRSEDMHFVVAANDMQRDLLFPQLVRQALRDGVDLKLEFKPSGVPSVSLLRDVRCDLLLTPLPPDAPDMIQHKLFSAARYSSTDLGGCVQALS